MHLTYSPRFPLLPILWTILWTNLFSPQREELAELEAAGIIGFDPPIGLLPARSSAPLKGRWIFLTRMFHVANVGTILVLGPFLCLDHACV